MSTADRVAAAIAYALGYDESVADVVGDVQTFVRQVGKATDNVERLLTASTQLIQQEDEAMATNPALASPVLVAIAHRLDCSVEQAGKILDQLRDLPTLPNRQGGAEETDQPRRRGRPFSRNPLVGAAVRGAMLALFEQGRAYTGGWKSLRGKSTMARLQEDEWAISGAAAEVVAAVIDAGLDADKSAIKKHMGEYVKELREKGRPPALEDILGKQL